MTIIFSFLLHGGTLNAGGKVHERNIKLLKLGLIEKIPSYYPEIPRIMATEALDLYNKEKALFVHTSHSDKHLIYGAIHLPGFKAAKIDPNKLPLKKGQVLVLY